MTYKQGDKVKVTFEAEVSSQNDFGNCICTSTGKIRPDVLKFVGARGGTVEVLAQTFKPGDIVVNKHGTDKLLITKGGYVNLSNGYKAISWSGTWTSETYEKVDRI